MSVGEDLLRQEALDRSQTASFISVTDFNTATLRDTKPPQTDTTLVFVRGHTEVRFFVI